MATKLTRYTQLLFGSSAGSNQIAEFGSLAASSPERYSGSTITPALVQGLSNYLDGWFQAIVNGNAIALEDLNALCYLFSYQLAYGFQAGVPEWDSATEYFIGSLVNSGGILYVSLTNSNLNNAVTSQTNWAAQGSQIRTTTTTDTMSAADSYVRMNTTGASFVETLPQASATPIGQKFIIKNVGTGSFAGTVTAHSGDLIDGSASITLNSSPAFDSVTLINNGTGWDIV